MRVRRPIVGAVREPPLHQGRGFSQRTLFTLIINVIMLADKRYRRINQCDDSEDQGAALWI
jgi:hypothetical protein